MIKNKKGFTLIEILAVITILGILMGIGIVSISRIIAQGKIKHYETAEKNMYLAGQSYAQTNRAALPKAVGQKTKISLATLVEKNYIQPIKDYSGNECNLEESYVQVFKYSQKDYSYMPVLKCYDSYDGTKDSETTYSPEITASINVDENKRSATANVTINGNDKLMSYSYIIYRGTKEVKNSGNTTVKGHKESVSFTISLTEYTPGNIKVVVNATNIYGNTKTKTVTKTMSDQKAPTCIIKAEDQTTSEKSWTTGTRTLTVGCDDGEGSGCTREEYSKTFRGTHENGEIIISDESGNTTSCQVSVYIDNDAPTCSVSGGNSSWINKTSSTTKRTITATCSDPGGSGCKKATQTKDYSTNIDTETAGVVGDGQGGYVEDMVGNRTNCEANQTVKIDKNAPTMTYVSTIVRDKTADDTGTKYSYFNMYDTGGSGLEKVYKSHCAEVNTNSYDYCNKSGYSAKERLQYYFDNDFSKFKPEDQKSWYSDIVSSVCNAGYTKDSCINYRMRTTYNKTTPIQYAFIVVDKAGNYSTLYNYRHPS